MSNHWPSYPDREVLSTRASGAEVGVIDDHAATALDRLRVTDDMLATAHPPPSDFVPATRRRPAAQAPSHNQPSAVAAWPVLLATAFVGGMAGALFGLWLALG